MLKIIQILMSSRHRSLDGIVNKYGFVIFNERLQQSDCQSFSDLILDIYQRLNLPELKQDQIVSVLNYLMSDNGIMAPKTIIKDCAGQLFLTWYKEQKKDSELLRPYIAHFLINLAP